MNLHGIVASVIGTVNPMVPIQVRRSTGYSTASDGKRTPTFTSVTIQAQIQPLQANDITFLDSLQIQGMRRKIYVSGDIEGIVRVDKEGGDLAIFPDGSEWKVAVVIEKWPDWCSVAVVLQNPNQALQ